MFRYLVLGLLRRGEPLHGYALMKEYRERAGVQISTGSFYRELARLVTEGLVRTASNPPGSDPRRAPYEVTDLGASAFDAWFSEPLGSDAGPHEDGLSARAVFLAEAGPAAARPALERWYDELWQRGKALEREREIALRAAGTATAPLPCSRCSWPDASSRSLRISSSCMSSVPRTPSGPRPR